MADGGVVVIVVDINRTMFADDDDDDDEKNEHARWVTVGHVYEQFHPRVPIIVS